MPSESPTLCACQALDLAACRVPTCLKPRKLVPRYNLGMADVRVLPCCGCSAYDRAAFKMRAGKADLNFPDTDYTQDSFMRVWMLFLPSCASKTL